mgnify:CR=1 FL=1|jgi:hypothetical protein
MAKPMKNPMSLFKGKDDRSEELKEAKALKSGKITPQQYAAGEKKEDRMKKFARGGLVGRGQGEARTKRTKCC